MHPRQSIVIISIHLTLFMKGFCRNTVDFCENDSEENSEVKTPGCVIPSLDLMDPSIRNMVHYPKNIGKCRNHTHPLLGRNQTHIWTIKENLPYYTKNKKTKLQCCYFAILMYSTRRGPVPSYQNCVPFTEAITAAEEFVRVTCNVASYEEFFMFTPKKDFTPIRKHPFEIPKNLTNNYNVMILGLSLMSRLNFRRSMPNTFKFLNSIGGIEMMGYNVVSGNTVANVLAFLLGLDEAEMRQTCWPTFLDTVDRCPFVWERFKDMGYYTAFLEDSSKYSIFSMYPGYHAFSIIPTDYYLYPFIKEAENTDLICLGNQLYFQATLDYLENLTTTLKTEKLFSIFWESSMTSLKLNNGMLMDHSYERFLIKLQSSGYLNNTILILLSEHGMGRGDIHETAQGRLEERLPLLYILPPPSFSKNYNLAYNKLKRNSKRLVTPFDVYETLLDLHSFDALQNKEIPLQSPSDALNKRSVSLFTAISCNRICEAVNISKNLCTCQQSRAIPRDLKTVRMASKFLIKHINDMIRPYSQCTPFKVHSVVAAADLFLWYEFAEEWRDLALTVRTKPGGAEFAATIRYQFDKNRLDTSEWSVVSPIKRINSYSDQSQCVQNSMLKMYCYCQNLKE